MIYNVMARSRKDKRLGKETRRLEKVIDREVGVWEKEVEITHLEDSVVIFYVLSNGKEYATFSDIKGAAEKQNKLVKRIIKENGLEVRV